MVKYIGAECGKGLSTMVNTRTAAIVNTIVSAQAILSIEEIAGLSAWGLSIFASASVRVSRW